MFSIIILEQNVDIYLYTREISGHSHLGIQKSTKLEMKKEKKYLANFVAFHLIKHKPLISKA